MAPGPSPSTSVKGTSADPVNFVISSRHPSIGGLGRSSSPGRIRGRRAARRPPSARPEAPLAPAKPNAHRARDEAGSSRRPKPLAAPPGPPRETPPRPAVPPPPPRPPARANSLLRALIGRRIPALLPEPPF